MARKDMPQALFEAFTSPRSIYELHMDAFPGQKELHERSTLYQPGTWLLGYVLPPFQRPIVWEEARMIRFIESAWLGFHLGTYVVNDAMDLPMVGGRFHRTDRWLIDGLQRLTALDRYFHDAFAVFGKRWSEISRGDQLSLLNTIFTASKVRMDDEHALRELYDRLNFGGIAHTEDQRALPTSPSA